MPRATCRCGQQLDIPADESTRLVCPSCAANVRIRRNPAAAPADREGDFIRFNCPCGRRLKVQSGGRSKPSHGKCPDCGRVVPVPSTTQASARDPEAPTEELTAADAAVLDAWTRRHNAAPGQGAGVGEATTPLPVPVPAEAAPGAPAWRSEAGLRICPGCGRPVHLGASTCRACGIPVPKR